MQGLKYKIIGGSLVLIMFVFIIGLVITLVDTSENDAPTREEIIEQALEEERSNPELQDFLRANVEEYRRCVQAHPAGDTFETVRIDGQNTSRSAAFYCSVESEQRSCISRGGDEKYCYYKQAVANHYSQICENTEDLKIECYAVLADFDDKMASCEQISNATEQQACFAELRSERHEKKMEILSRTNYK
jgi:hypothetical protein